MSPFNTDQTARSSLCSQTADFELLAAHGNRAARRYAPDCANSRNVDPDRRMAMSVGGDGFEAPNSGGGDAGAVNVVGGQRDFD